MINSIVVVADVHIKNYKDIEEADAIIEKFHHELSLNRPDRIVIAGDVFDSKSMVSPEANDLTQKFLRGCAENTDKVIMIAGNHDLIENNLDRMDSLTPIVNALKLPNLIYSKNSQIIHDDNVVWALFGIVDSNVNPLTFDVDTTGKRVVGVYHGIIDGMYNDLGHKFKSENNVRMFTGCDVVFCGDIHRRQVIENDNHKIFMVGSMMQQGFYETVSGHGYLTYNLSDDSYQFTDISTPVVKKRYQITDIEDIYNNGEVWVNS